MIEKDKKQNIKENIRRGLTRIKAIKDLTRIYTDKDKKNLALSAIS